jgi:ribonuclease HII
MFEAEEKVRQEGFDFIIGIDEAGRGPLAGPVVAAAVLVKEKDFHSPIRDSKKLSPKQREKAFHEIYQKSFVGVGVISETVIDKENILQATFLAMESAVKDLIRQIPPDVRDGKDFSKKVCLLVDGNQFKSSLPYAHESIISGDSLVFSISAASIIAKVTRDNMLDAYDKIFPQYGFKKHKGYGTLFHRNAIKQYGLSAIHRKTFSQKFCVK